MSDKTKIKAKRKQKHIDHKKIRTKLKKELQNLKDLDWLSDGYGLGYSYDEDWMDQD